MLVSGPSHGTLTFNADGTLHLHRGRHVQRDRHVHLPRLRRPAPERPGDGDVHRHPLNQPPVSVADAYSVNEDGSLTVAAPGVLGNDTDPEGQPLSYGIGQRPGTRHA